jgi:arylsulfatase A-like enzyme
MMIGYLQHRADSQTPFCAVLSYGSPHDPWTDNNVPPRFRELFKDVEFPDPASYSDGNDPYADAWGRLSPAERGQLSIWRRNYYAMTANLDWNYSRLLRALDEQGLTEDTIVVFSSDHGEMFGAHGRRAKNTFYEEAIRIPYLIRWPAHIPAGTVSGACVSTVDIVPTLLGLMDLSIPAGAEGMDCSLLARGERGPEPGAALLQNTGACAAWEDGFEWRALRDKRYTYAVYRRDGSELLFDNVVDPYQLQNLASDGQHAKMLEALRNGLSVKMASLGDTFESCTWYRDNWTSNREIVRSATMS